MLECLHWFESLDFSPKLTPTKGMRIFVANFVEALRAPDAFIIIFKCHRLLLRICVNSYIYECICIL